MLLITPDQLTIVSAPLVTSTDGYNSWVRDWVHATRTVTSARVQPVTTTELLESTGSRDQIVSRFKIWLPPFTAVTAVDRIEWNSLVLAVDGEPQVWNDFFGTPDHVELLAVVSAG